MYLDVIRDKTLKKHTDLHKYSETQSSKGIIKIIRDP